MKKIYKIFTGVMAILIASVFMGLNTSVKIARAGQSDFIVPLFSAYAENEEATSIIKQNTVIDMSKYNGVGEIDVDTGKITAISSYTISNTQAGAKLCVPYMGTMNDLNVMDISINGQPVQVERLYGDTPSYFAGENEGFISVVEAIESVQPTTIKDGTAKIYTFEAIGGEIEFSFQKNADQTVIHNGTSWSSQGINGYSFKGKNSDMEEYPYQVFVSKGELIDFQSNVEYTVSDISYKEYVDYYLNECIAELGEEYRPYYYSQFNRRLSGGVFDVDDVLYNYSAYAFVLMKVELPVGNSQIVINSGVSALVNALYEPYIYTIRTISPYPQDCEFSLEVKVSEQLPYLLEDNIGFTEMKYNATSQKADGYFIVSSEKSVKNVIEENKPKDYTILYIICGCLFVIGVSGLIVTIIIVCREKRRK